MKKITTSLVTVCFLFLSGNANSQMVTNDPIHTAITTLIKMFQDPSFKTMVSNIEKLKKVTSAVRQFHRGTEIISSVTNITTKLTKYSTAIAKDGHIYPVEYKLMSEDIKIFTNEATKIVKDMKAATTSSGGVLQMTDAERAKWLDDTYMKIAHFESKVTRYFERIQAVSLKRSASKADLTATAKLYEVAAIVPEGYMGGGQVATIPKNGYDTKYNDSLQIPLDYLYKTKAYQDFQKKMRECEFRNQMFYKAQEYEAKKMETLALAKLWEEGYKMVAKNGFLQSKSSAQQDMHTILSSVLGDSASYQSTTSNGAALNFNMDTVFENEILAIYDPSGKRIDSETFRMMVEFRGKEMYLEYGIDQQLEAEYKIKECKELAQDFDRVMKAAEAEYLSKL